MKKNLEDKIFDAKIGFTLKDLFEIAIDFHKLIINMMKRKKQMMVEVIMVMALDSYLTKRYGKSSSNFMYLYLKRCYLKEKR